MVCAGFDADVYTGIAGFLSYPSSCDYHFWAKILFGLWVILVFILYQSEKDKIVKPDILSIMGVSSLAIIFIAAMGSIVGFISSGIMLEVFVVGMIFVAIWFFKR